VAKSLFDVFKKVYSLLFFIFSSDIYHEFPFEALCLPASPQIINCKHASWKMLMTRCLQLCYEICVNLSLLAVSIRMIHNSRW